jgi:hypothetical protein
VERNHGFKFLPVITGSGLDVGDLVRVLSGKPRGCIGHGRTYASCDPANLTPSPTARVNAFFLMSGLLASSIRGGHYMLIPLQMMLS